MIHVPGEAPSELALFTADDSISEAGRRFLRAQLAVMGQHQAALQANGEALAVHETRKAIRRIRSVMDLLAPYYPAGFFKPHRKALRHFMRRLGPARDLAVFLQKLDAFRATFSGTPAEQASLNNLYDYWLERLRQAEQQVTAVARSERYQQALADFAAQLAEPVALEHGQVRDLAAGLLREQLAQVLTYGEVWPAGSLEQWHELRIRFKRLRYSLDFFAPVLGEEAAMLAVGLNTIQDHLGDLNDARMAAIYLLEQTPHTDGRAAGIALYTQAKQQEIAQLQQQFAPLWAAFNSNAWREQLDRALAAL